MEGVVASMFGGSLDHMTSTIVPPAEIPKVASDDIDPDVLCGHTSKLDPLVIASKFYVAGVLVAVTAGVGLLGNLISLITLSTMSRRGLFIKLLLTLTTFDTLFLISGGIFMLQQAFNFTNPVYNALFPKVIYPLAGFSMTGKYAFTRLLTLPLLKVSKVTRLQNSFLMELEASSLVMITICMVRFNGHFLYIAI
jgi:hypothetical protein